MDYRFVRPLAAAAAAASLAACGSIDVWPFGGEKYVERPRGPANAVEYRCTGGKGFYVRHLDTGAVWLILRDREVRLDKVADSRYSNGIAVLDLGGAEATLTDGPNAYAGCKTAGK